VKFSPFPSSMTSGIVVLFGLTFRPFLIGIS
jgi:hypothetical protein